MRFTTLILKNLIRRKTRSALTVTGLAAAVATTTALLNMVWGYARSTVDFYGRRGVDIVVTRAGVADRTASNLNSAVVARIAALPGVARAEGTLIEQFSFGRQTLVGIPLQGLDPDGFAISALTIVAGRNLTVADRSKLLLGTALARTLGKQPGDSVDVEGTSFQVSGLFRTDDPLEAATAIGRLIDVQELAERPGSVSEVEVGARNGDNDDQIRRLCAGIESLADANGRPLGLEASPTQQFVHSEMTFQLATAVAWSTSVLAIALSLLVVLNTMLMSTFERTKEFGMLRAIGWRRARILRMIVGESLAIGTIAAIGGIVAAWCVVRVLCELPATQSFISPHVLPMSVLCGVTLAIAAGLIGALYPAYRGATISPVEALRYE